MIFSPVPRNLWTSTGQVVRASRDYGLWAQEVARAEKSLSVDLNSLVANRYEALGRETVEQGFFTPTDHTHITLKGAKLNADCVAEAIRSWNDPLVSSAVLPGKSLKTDIDSL